MNLNAAWQQAQSSIRQQIGTTSYDTWFSALKILVKEDHLTIIAPDEFFKNWIMDHYKDLIIQTICRQIGRKISIDYASDNTPVQNRQQKIEFIEKEYFQQKNPSLSNLNNRFTFDNFVVGPSNRFACAASLAVAESPAKAYNPLFIYGQVGLGKTHLIQSITHKIRQLHPQLQIRYMSSEQFTNELINAIRNRSTDKFRKKYRNIDVLLIDDIQFIAGKESTQEEFFHTFNNLHNNHKQIIITSDRSPKEIAKLEERLSSRFAWGLITDIQPPDFETRVAILRKKVETERYKIPEDVIDFIADEIQTNIRELEGALIRVSAYSQIEDQPITLDVAKMVLKDMVRETSKTINIEAILKNVADYYRVPVEDLKTRKRHKNIVLPRQVAMFLSRQMTAHSLPEIGGAFGGKDHTTVLHACKKIEDLIKNDRDVKGQIQDIMITLKK